MKPYIEKNDGVPDNNRYSEALEAAKETVEALNKLTDQALAQYTALVDSAVAGHITDERELEHIMDGLLDFVMIYGSSKSTSGCAGTASTSIRKWLANTFTYGECSSTPKMRRTRMNNLRSKLSNLKNACHIFRHYLRWPYPMYKPSQFDSFNHEHTCLASKLTNIELSDICPLAKAGQPFEVARENTCEECKYFCRIHYEVDPEYGDKQVHFWMNEEIVTFF